MLRLLAGAGLLAGIGIAVTAVLAVGGSERAPASDAAAAPAPLVVTSALPVWRAPGVPLVVTGFAGAGARLSLLAGHRTVATAVAGRLGAFRLRFRAPAPGRYPLVVRASGRLRPLGTLAVRPLVLRAVGDIMLGERVGASIARHGGRHPWTAVAATLRDADIAVGNLETAVSTRGVPAAKEYVFRGPPGALPPMSSFAGFDVLSLANNHAADYGREALLDTVRHARAAGIVPIGAGADSHEARRPAILEAGGLRVALLAYSDVNPLGFPAGASTPGTAVADPAAIAADVRAARGGADVAACFFHWGVELRAQPDLRQQQLAATCLNAGAQLVLGAHPHVLGPVSRPSATTLVAWTLGNFVFPSFRAETVRTGILHVALDARGVRGFRLIPAQIDGFRPRLSGRELAAQGG
jgi:poly-gamma-glutamate synthesis protein (capsule biosynthesis protein)